MNELNPKNWVKDYAEYLFHFALQRVNDKETAEDLVQETFLSAYKANETFRGQASEKTWLTGILKNKIIDYYRKASTRFQKNVSSLDTAWDSDENQSEEKIWSKMQQDNANFESVLLSPTQIHENKELQNVIFNCFDKLPELWNSITRMKLIDDMETEEISNVFSLSKNNVWVIYHRAKLQLRICIEQNWIKP